LCCTGAPIIATLPHFYKSEDYLNNVDGLSPDVGKHKVQMYFEPVSRFHSYYIQILHSTKFKLLILTLPKGLIPIIVPIILMIFFCQMTGTPLLGYKRMQFNIFLKKEPKINAMKTLSEDEKLIPLFWIEEVN